MSYTDDNLTDRYGPIYLLTELEERGHCFWCGAAVTHGRRYCCDAHREKYHKYFHWPDASAWALERADGHCQHCGETKDLVVHHIEPLDGSLRLWNILNRPDNLIALCHSCHGKEHARLAGTLRLKTSEDKCQAALDAGQIPMELQYAEQEAILAQS
jgi:hypothetical protein